MQAGFQTNGHAVRPTVKKNQANARSTLVASTRGEEREWSAARRMSACRRKWSEDIAVAEIGKTGLVGPGLRGGFLGSLAFQSS